MEPNAQSSKIPEVTEKDPSERRTKVSQYCLFKMKIGDLLALDYDPAAHHFKFKNDVLSKVECGGKITDIFRDDDKIFSFELDDGSGAIKCFHKYKYDRAALLESVNELTARSSLSTMSISDESSIFNATNDNTIVRDSERDAKEREAVGEILAWFDEEIVAKQKSPSVGDLIHVQGHLVKTDDEDGIRKINVLDFRTATKEEREDMKMEINYLHHCVY